MSVTNPNRKRALLTAMLTLTLFNCGSNPGSSVSGSNASSGSSISAPAVPPDQFSLVFTSPDVDVHQGYATDGTFHYLLDTDRIIKRDGNWSVVTQNTTPRAGTSGTNHMGDGDYYHGMLYLPEEHYTGCNDFSNQAVFIYDAANLQRISVIPVAGDHEMSGLAVDPDHSEIWITSFCDGSKIWVYDLLNLELKRTVPLQPNVSKIQGIAYRNNEFYLSKHEGSIWKVTREGVATQVYKSPLTAVHEGLDYSQSELRWLIDGGTGNKKLYYLSPK